MTTVKKKCTGHIELEKLLIWILKKIAQPIPATNDDIDNS